MTYFGKKSFRIVDKFSFFSEKLIIQENSMLRFQIVVTPVTRPFIVTALPLSLCIQQLPTLNKLCRSGN